MERNTPEDPQKRLKICAFQNAKIEASQESDSILPHEIPKSLSFSNWMRNQREALEFLHPNALIHKPKPKRRRKRK